MNDLRKSSRQSGQAVLLFVLGIIMFCAFCAMVVDFGRQHITLQKLRNYCDESAMSGSNMLPDSGDCAPYLEALRIYARNIRIDGANPTDIPSTCGGNDPGYTSDPTTQTATDLKFGSVTMKTYHFIYGTDSIAVTTPYTDTNTQAKKLDPTQLIRVDACRTVKNHFGALLGWRQVRICTFGVARHIGGIAGGVVILNRTDRATLDDTGGGNFSVAGAIYVDSSHSSAMVVNNNATVTATGSNAAINVVGGANYNLGPPANVTPTPSISQPIITDPYATLPVPTTEIAAFILAGKVFSSVHLSNSSQTIEPGIYLGGIDVTGGTLIMKPGIYIIAGGGFSITSSGGASVELNPSPPPTILAPGGVMIYNTGSGGTPVIAGETNFASVKLTGQSALTLSAMTTGIYTDILLFQDRLNTKPANITGGSATTITGNIYMKSANLGLSGAGSGTLGTLTLQSNLVVDTLTVSGQGDLKVLPPALFSAGGIGSALIE